LAVVHSCAKLLFYLCRIPIKTKGINNIPMEQTCVYVSNHASYLDGAVLSAIFPVKLSFVAKEELQQKFISRVFLRRIGTEFVERFDQEQGIAGAQHAVQSLKSGQSLLFFPEGTFTRSPGLLPFRMGAFTSAASTNTPVIPISIHGTRSILRSDSWFPRRGIVSVVITAPIIPQGTQWSAAVELRNISRAKILRYSGEPDLE
jgi:1-acyl-sn-glycerol-3-phosphate acyltransferase